VLWGVPIGPPSAHKTPAMKAAHSALAAIDHELYLDWKKECEQLEAQHQMALDAQAADGKSKKTVKKPEKPPLKHLLHDDTSLEKLTINMAASPHGAVAFYSELAAWFASFSRYSGGDDSSGRALWNRAYDAERFKRDRVKNEGPPIVVPAAACSVVGAIQPDKLRQIWPKSHDGLLARPIYVWPRLAPLPSEQSDSNGDDVSGGETYAFRKPSTICRSSLMTMALLIPQCFVWRATPLAIQRRETRLRASGAARARAHRRMARQKSWSHLKARAHFPFDDLVVERRRRTADIDRPRRARARHPLLPICRGNVAPHARGA
jgi:hypothetical protein